MSYKPFTLVKGFFFGLTRHGKTIRITDTMSDYLDPANEELLKDFYVEAEMQIEALESNVLVLENDPDNHDAVDEIFRAAHTLKGGAATVQMTELAEFTHLVEDALDEIRSGRVKINEGTVDTLLQSIDIIKAMLSERQNGNVFDGDTTEIKEALKLILSGSTPAPASVPASAPATRSRTETVSAPEVNLTEYEVLELKEAAPPDHGLYEITVSFREDNPMNSVGGIQVFAALKQFGEVLKTVPDFDALYDDIYHPVVKYYIATKEDPSEQESRFTITDVTESVSIATLDSSGGRTEASPAAAAVPPPAAPSEPAPSREAPSQAAVPRVESPSEKKEESSDTADEAARATERAREAVVNRGGQQGSILRVDSRRIDNLLNLVSETVINKASFNQISNTFGENLSSFQHAESRFRESLKDLFESLPEYLDAIQRGETVKSVRDQMNERFGELPNLFDSFHGELKTNVAKFRNTSQNLGRIAGELQEGVMRIRMVPISQIFSRFPRLVRDLSRSLKKKINLEIEGEDTELDKSVIEDLLDPLIHCVRNSIDHGIEDPEIRRESGKDEAGTVRLRASNEGNMILIEIEDDGKGIDVENVRKKAIDRGIIHPNKQLSDVEAFNLIFDPGFSTAEKITNVSGRGVGLDVVKRQIEKLNGTVKVWSERGLGTRFTIKIPLTLAIIQGLLVRVGKQMYAIPITSVIDSHRIKPSEIKMIDNYEVFNVREDVVSLIRLSRLFRIPTNENPDYHYVVIVGTSERKMGLIVDSLIGEEDVVIKPLRDHFTNSPGIAGANITGDGRVSLIIDVSQLLELGLRREKEERAKREMTVRS
jgi:two-component system, chemotaxis family, sensor kinase CheA